MEKIKEQYYNEQNLINSTFPQLRMDVKLKGIKALLNLMLDFNQRLSKARENGMRIAGLYGFTPTEAFYSAGIIPLSLGRCGTFTSILGQRDEVFRLAEENGLRRDNCDRLKGNFGSLIKGTIERPDLVVCSGSFCDNMTMLSQMIEVFLPVHYVDVPGRISDYAIDAMRLEYKKLLNRLETVSKKTITTSDLINQVELENSLRILLQEIHGLMANVPPPLSGLNAYIPQILPFDWLGEPKGLKQVFQVLINELKKRVENGASISSGEAIRLIVAGNGAVNYKMFDIIEDLGGIVVAVEARHALYSRTIDIEDDIIKSIAKWILSFPMRRGLRERSKDIIKLVKDQNADGVIYNTAWGCTHLAAAPKPIKDLLAVKGIPVTVLDLANRESAKSGQIRTRISAFIEMVRQGKKDLLK